MTICFSTAIIAKMWYTTNESHILSEGNAMSEVTILTREGYDRLVNELEYLKTKKRAEVADKIRVARGFGDLSENAEYDAAKDEQAEVEQRISTIERQLKNYQIIEEDDDSDSAAVVKLGSTVKVLDIEYNEELVFTIVGTVEANPKKNKISNESPLGKMLLGSEAGQTLNVETPNGIVQYQVLEIIR